VAAEGLNLPVGHNAMTPIPFQTFQIIQGMDVVDGAEVLRVFEGVRVRSSRRVGEGVHFFIGLVLRGRSRSGCGLSSKHVRIDLSKASGALTRGDAGFVAASCVNR
jgi:hypothetical protein